MKKLVLLMFVGLVLKCNAMEQAVKKGKGEEQEENIVVQVPEAMPLAVVPQTFPASSLLAKIINAGVYDEKRHMQVPKDVQKLIVPYVLTEVMPFIKHKCEVLPIILDNSAGPPLALSFNKEGDKIVVGYEEGLIRIFTFLEDGSTTSEELDPGDETLGNVASASFNEAGDKVIVCRDDGVCSIWSVKSGEYLKELQGGVYSSFNSAGDKVVTCYYNGTVRIFLVESGECLKELQHPEDMTVFSAVFNGAGDRVVTCSRNGKVRIWSVESGECLWSVESGECLKELNGPDESSWAFFNKEGDKVIIGSGQNTVSIWSVESGKLLSKLEEYYEVGRSRIISVSYNNEANKVVVSYSSGIVRIWSLESDNPLLISVRTSGEVWAASINNAGDKVIAGNADCELCMWDLGVLKRFKRSCSLTQAFLLNAIYEVVKLRQLSDIRTKAGKPIVTMDFLMLLKNEFKFDFKNYKDYEKDYEELPQAIKDIFDPYVIRTDLA